MVLSAEVDSPLSLKIPESINKNERFPHFKNLLQSTLTSDACNQDRMRTLKMLIGGLRKRETFDVTPLHSLPTTPEQELVPIIIIERMNACAKNQTTFDESPCANSLFRNYKPKGWNYLLDDYSKRDKAWTQLMSIIEIVKELTVSEVKRLSSVHSFGDDLSLDMLIGVFAERDWTIFAELFTLDKVDSAYLLLFLCEVLDQSEIDSIEQQLNYWKEKIVHENHYRSIGTGHKELFNNSEYDAVDEIGGKIVRAQGLSLQAGNFEIIRSWLFENVFRISKKPSSSRHDLWMSDLWYCPLWLQMIAFSEVADTPSNVKLLLAEYENAVREWMDVIVKSVELKNLRGLNRPTFKIFDLIEYLKQDHIALALPQIASTHLCDEIANMEMYKGWDLAQSIAGVLLELRYEIIRSNEVIPGNNTADLDLVKTVYQAAINCFKNEFMIDTWMSAKPVVKMKHSNRFLSDW